MNVSHLCIDKALAALRIGYPRGTQGPSLAVRRIWQIGKDIPMIHACHLDLRDARTVNKIIGRTAVETCCRSLMQT